VSIPGATEGLVPFRGYRTWYRIVGDISASGSKVPLLVLHGGPGFPHDYLFDLARLSDGGRPVVFYDQIGCGRSDRPDDTTLWAMETFVDEVATIRAALGLERVHLLGHSWGGWLALEYALGKPAGLASLTLASTCASILAFAAETRRLKETLPRGIQDILDRHEADGTTGDPDYVEAALAYHRQWVCRLDPHPAHVRQSFAGFGADVYEVMQGPEWSVTGTLKDWDVTARLAEIGLPVLVTSGRHDEMTPALVDPLAAGIKGAERVVFPNSSHLAMAEEPDRYCEVLGSFLDRVEAGRHP
jgi:L-proline amide hydrolase